MSLPNPYATSPSGWGPPPPPPSDPGKLRPSRVWFVVGSALLAAAVGCVVIAIVFFVHAVSSAVVTFDGDAPGIVAAKADHDYTIYTSTDDPVSLSCTVTGPQSVDEVRVGPDDGFFVEQAGYTYDSALRFHASLGGLYEVRCTADSGETPPLAVGERQFSRVIAGVAAVFVAFVVGAAGLVTIIVTAVRRSHARRRIAGGGWGPSPWQQPQPAAPPPPIAQPPVAGGDPWAAPPS